jgi:hypothetical protein
MDLSDQRHGGHLHSEEGEFPNTKSLNVCATLLISSRTPSGNPHRALFSDTLMNNGASAHERARYGSGNSANKNIDLSLLLPSVRTGSSV